MPDSEEHNFKPHHLERRRQIWRKLIAEGVLQDKQSAELTEDDLEAIAVRLSLEDHAAAEGISVEQMFGEWQDDSKFVHGPFTTEEMMEWLDRSNDDADEDARFGRPGGHAASYWVTPHHHQMVDIPASGFVTY